MKILTKQIIIIFMCTYSESNESLLIVKMVKRGHHTNCFGSEVSGLMLFASAGSFMFIHLILASCGHLL